MNFSAQGQLRVENSMTDIKLRKKKSTVSLLSPNYCFIHLHHFFFPPFSVFHKIYSVSCPHSFIAKVFMMLIIQGVTINRATASLQVFGAAAVDL